MVLARKSTIFIEFTPGSRNAKGFWDESKLFIDIALDLEYWIPIEPARILW